MQLEKLLEQMENKMNNRDLSDNYLREKGYPNGLEVEKEVSKEYQQKQIDQLMKIINDEQNREERVEELLDKNRQYCFNEDGHTGKCLGYSRFDDDEPCDYCKSCEKINTEEE